MNHLTIVKVLIAIAMLCMIGAAVEYSSGIEDGKIFVKMDVNVSEETMNNLALISNSSDSMNWSHAGSISMTMARLNDTHEVFIQWDEGASENELTIKILKGNATLQKLGSIFPQ